MTTTLDLTSFKALSFDCCGTLIDWEAGIGAALTDWAAEQGLSLTTEQLLLAYADNEAAVEREAPTALYSDVLAEAFRRTGAVLGTPVSDAWAARLGDSVPNWPAFPDSADALARLAQHYQLIILSNVHRAGFAGSNERLCGDFAAIITAEDVGAYKPAANHFRALDATLPELGVERSELLHVAQSLFHDHVPAKTEGCRRFGSTAVMPSPAGARPRSRPRNGPTIWSSPPGPPLPTPSTPHSALLPRTRPNLQPQGDLDERPVRDPDQPGHWTGPSRRHRRVSGDQVHLHPCSQLNPHPPAPQPDRRLLP
jgi:2-haloacid dehalogenase